nr:protein spitz-like [Lepeophtheirus salmonis]
MVSQSRCMFPGLGLNWRSVFLFLVGVLLRGSEACSSRSTPKPRSPIHSAIRPDITFQTYACPPAYAAWYCLNGATCFAVKIAESILYNCECADGYMGQRCEFKDPDGSYLPARKKLYLLKSPGFGLIFLTAFGLVILAAILGALYTKHRTKSKLTQLRKEVEVISISSKCSTNIQRQSISFDISSRDRLEAGPKPSYYDEIARSSSCHFLFNSSIVKC